MSLLPSEPANGPGPRVKVCGVTRPQDVAACIAAKVDAIGFNLAAGPRRINTRQTARLSVDIPSMVTPVLLVMDWSLEEVQQAIVDTAITTVQLHGRESAEFAAALRPQATVIKAFRVRDAATLDAVREYPCDIALLDAYVPGVAGGTGAAWDHHLLGERIAAGFDFGKPIMIAGGLRADNVADAVAATQAWAVDTASGVESAPAIKEAAKISAFVEAVRG